MLKHANDSFLIAWVLKTMELGENEQWHLKNEVNF